MLVTSYVNGATAGSPPPPRDHSNDPKRGVVKGWSSDAVRRHTKWLYAVDGSELSGVGIAATLTIRDTPATAAEWHMVRRRWARRLERAGAVRVHWVVEWQRRGTPHLHTAVYWPEGTSETEAMGHVLVSWLQASREYSPSFRSQDAKRIEGALGWLQYLSKHAARGVRHYQRQGHPEGWDKTARLWGHVGEWPVVPPLRFDMSREAYWRYRRLCRSWRIANARQDPAVEKRAARISFARRMLASSDRKLSAVRGVSDWIPEDVAMQFLALLTAEGYLIVQRPE